MNAILKMVNKTGSVKNSRFITKITALSLILLFSVIAAVSFGPINIKNFRYMENNSKRYNSV